jgi:DNA invertase Pin-like site-specific DNA recombinase
VARQGKSRAAVAYLRTSSAANIGADKDSDRRQREAIQGFARRAGIEVVDEFYDPAVSGGDPVESRPGFIAMLKRIEGNGVRTIIVETASRFARDLMVQEVGYAMLTERGIELIAADSPQSFIEDTPTARLIRQVLGAVSEFDKAMTVAKLRGARERKRKDGATRTRKDGSPKVEGRKSIAEWEGGAQIIEEAKRLRRKRPKGGQRSYRQIATELCQSGYVNSRGRAFSPSMIKAMIEGPTILPARLSRCRETH